ncbi:DUF2993 domain-containing protein [Streptomyces sp. DSM 44917]|uniref:DUF2993 domain-containing protein n=1 Tax=Streptomyces boetiae TaxID=3075541 RepID=A0ABU2L1V3_9ACTN|nr:DUF2993 domain-containing protein [Streptomyces sp. DSM 44917]MDT0305540.1 DUF2993 domain-containing protein [Streptomyces sp. DSM 44917]
MRALRISLIVFGILLVLAVAADRVAVWIAQGEVASRARDSLALEAEPDVSIRGFPFLTQAAGGSLNRVDLGMDDYAAEVGGQSLTVQELDIELNDVELTDGYSSAVARTAEGEGLVAYEALTEAYGRLLEVGGTGFGVEFGYAPEGRLSATLQASVLGQSIDLGEVVGDIVLEDGAIRLEVNEEDIPDAGGEATREAIREQLNEGRELSGLPEGITLESLTPTEDGLALALTGTDVRFNG